jgi:hypothetical protein
MPKHIKKSTIKTAIHGFKKREHLKFKQIIKQDFPQLYQIFKNISDELENIMVFLNKIFDYVDKSMDEFTKDVSEGLDKLTNDVSNTVDSIGSGIDGLFKPSGQTWGFNKQPQEIVAGKKFQRKAEKFLHPDFGMNDLNRFF